MMHGTRIPFVGEDLGGGRWLLDYRHIADGGDGTYSHGEGLCMWVRDETKFVVWRSVVWNDDRSCWVTEQGDYHRDLGSAWAAWTR